jgi:hypothetical protein
MCTNHRAVHEALFNPSFSTLAEALASFPRALGLHCERGLIFTDEAESALVHRENPVLGVPIKWWAVGHSSIQFTTLQPNLTELNWSKFIVDAQAAL